MNRGLPDGEKSAKELNRELVKNHMETSHRRNEPHGERIFCSRRFGTDSDHGDFHPSFSARRMKIFRVRLYCNAKKM
ncbi:hypothetical protein SAMN05216387_10738 [Nitrosovibrio tenuis]|uniref:Uncharacterized protein n=1 Tax=Nitrosovibrio tenuis TaxID=1233 RepID=A0A1H7NKL9_9PROT|nr:hypothetical protein SAMN05216387_10738 [Nitrosovibrio tenuis]